MPGATHFDDHADDYAQARPPYPPELWDRVRRTGLMRPGGRALDLGAGTGEATGPLLAAGMDVVTVEPGPRLAERLTVNHPAAGVVVASAEDFEPPERAFDLVVAATAIHWFDLDRVLPIVHRALTPNGRFLVCRNVFGDPEAPVTPFRERVERIVARRQRPEREGSPEDVDVLAGELSRSGLFDVEDSCTYRWTIALDEERVRRLFGTFSDWSGTRWTRRRPPCACLAEAWSSTTPRGSPWRHPDGLGAPTKCALSEFRLAARCERCRVAPHGRTLIRDVNPRGS